MSIDWIINHDEKDNHGKEFLDALVNAQNLATFKGLASELVQKSFSRFNLKKYFGANAEPLIFAQFVGGLDDKMYD